MKAKRTQKSCWYGVRSIFLFGKKKDGKNVFEERVVVFSAKTGEQAFSKAKKEAESYAKVLKMKRHPYMEYYIQDGEKLIDGYEVWSTLYDSGESLNEFVKNRYYRYQHHWDGYCRNPTENGE